LKNLTSCFIDNLLATFLRLKRPNDIERYVLHLASHFDPDSSELMKFLQSGLKNGFQESSINQFSTRFPQISSDVLGKIRERYVHRDFDSDTTHYIAHWINKLLVSIDYTDYWTSWSLSFVVEKKARIDDSNIDYQSCLTQNQ